MGSTSNIVLGGPRAYIATAPVGTGSYADQDFDYNLYGLAGNNRWYYAGGSKYSTLATWQGSGDTSVDPHASTSTDPKFDNGGTFDLDLQWDSPGIDTGYMWWNSNAGDVTDYLGHAIYGRPDIGAYEYQPPSTMGANALTVGRKVRVYADGKFRDLESSAGATANLTVQPDGGWGSWTATQARPFWADVEITAWDTSGTSTWTVDMDDTANSGNLYSFAPNANYTTSHTLTGLGSTPASYKLTVGGVVQGTFISKTDGTLTFTYTGSSYNDLTFSLVKTGAVYWVGPVSGEYGAEDGSSYANAFDGVTDINWSGMAAGDTLVMFGTFTNPINDKLLVGKSGTSSDPVTIRGDASAINPAADAQIFTTNNFYPVGSAWNGPDGNGVYNKTGVTYVTPQFAVEDFTTKLTKLTGIPTTQPGFWYLNEATDTLYYKPTSGTATSHSFYTSNDGGAQIDLQGNDYVRLHKLTAMGNGQATGRIVLLSDSTNVTINQSTFKFAQRAAIEVIAESDNVVISNSIIDNVGNGILQTRNTTSPDNLVIRGNTIRNVNQDGTYGDLDAFAIRYQTGTGALVENNTIYNVAGVGIAFKPGGTTWTLANSTVRGNFIHDVSKTSGSLPLQQGIAFIAPTGYVISNSTGNQVYNNLISDVADAGIYSNASFHASGTWAFYSNTVYAATYGYRFDEAITGNIQFPFKDNIVAGSTTRHADHGQSGDSRTNVDINYNLYYDDSGSKFEWNGTNYNFSGWKTNSSPQQGLLSSVNDPKFASSGGSRDAISDFELLGDSTAVDATNIYAWWGTAHFDITPDAGVIDRFDGA